MRIGEVARRLGVATHVLRHWDETGVVSPARTSSGPREYTEEDLHRLRVLQACREVGLSLADVRIVLHRDEPGRTAVIDRHRARLREQRRLLEAAEAFLRHVRECEHDLLTRCASCSTYPAGNRVPAPDGRRALGPRAGERAVRPRTVRVSGAGPPRA